MPPMPPPPAGTPPAFLWLVDITDETRPVPFASFQIDEEDCTPKPEYTRLHQFCEEIRSTEIPIAWFAHALKVAHDRFAASPERKTY